MLVLHVVMAKVIARKYSRHVYAQSRGTPEHMTFVAPPLLVLPFHQSLFLFLEVVIDSMDQTMLFMPRVG